MAGDDRLKQGSGRGFDGRGRRVQPTFDDEPLSRLGRYVKDHPDTCGEDSIGYCTRCYMGNAFWRERCQRCGNPKPYLYADEILRARLPPRIRGHFAEEYEEGFSDL